MIIIILALIFIAIGIIISKRSRGNLELFGVVLIILAIVALLIGGIWIMTENINPESKYITYFEKREAIVKLYENELYKNDNNIGSVEVFEKIGNWNSEIKSAQYNRNKILISWLYGSYYDRLEPIEF